MSSTDELKALLDERNVKYKDRDMFGKYVFYWGEPLHGAMFTVSLSGEWTELVVENPTPQQAIDATLGRGECKVVSYTTDGLMSDDPKRFFHLSCGHWVGLPGLTDVPKFCPECGLAVRR